MENAVNNYSNKKKNSIKNTKTTFCFYPKSLFVCILLLVLIIVEIVNGGGYVDEVIGVVSVFYLMFFRNHIERHDIITIMILACVVLIGLVSNLVSGLISSITAIGIDVVAETKLLFAYFAMKYFLSDREKQAVIDMLLPLARLYTILMFVLSIASQFVDLGMTAGERYGIASFRFVFTFAHQYVAVYMLVFGILVCNTSMSSKKKKYYYAMAIVSLILATKAPPILFSIMFVGLAINYKKRDSLSPIVFIIGIPLLIYAGWYQIEEYLINENAPRRIFFEYSFATANRYFPLGSGFATFGSDQAARNYSQLYYRYGFDKLFGMNPDDTAFLNDTFWPMAIGQFGWIGSILYIVVFIRIFMTFSNKKFNNERKAFLYAAYLQYMIHAIGSAILSSSAGMIGFMAIAIFTVSENEQDKHKSRLKVHF